MPGGGDIDLLVIGPDTHLEPVHLVAQAEGQVLES